MHVLMDRSCIIAHSKELVGNMDMCLLLVSCFSVSFLLVSKEIVTERPGSGIRGRASEQEASLVSWMSCSSAQQGCVIVLCAPLLGGL